MKELFNRDEVRDYIAFYKRLYPEDHTGPSIISLKKAGVDPHNEWVTEEEIDRYIRYYFKTTTKKISHKQFVRELTVYRDYFKLHDNQCGLDVVNKLINDCKIYDKCVKITDGSFFNARIFFYLHPNNMLQIEGVEEGISWKDAIDQLYRDYEIIPCHWFPFDSVFELEGEIEEEEARREGEKYITDNLYGSMAELLDEYY